MDNPHAIADNLVKLSEGYSKMTAELIEVLQIKAVKWAEARAVLETNAETDKAWEATPEGIKEMTLKLKLKASEKRMSALRTMLRIMETEARNMM